MPSLLYAMAGQLRRENALSARRALAQDLGQRFP